MAMFGSAQRRYRTKMKYLVCICCSLFAMSVALAQPVFTGNVSADFIGPGAVCLQDPGEKDVGLPMDFAPTSASGWDVKAICFCYDLPTDTMYIGADFYGIAGDADGDGHPNHTGSMLQDLGGADEPDLSGTEAVVLLIDTDRNGSYDIATGVSGKSDLSSFGSYRFNGKINSPAFGFGKRLSPDPTSLYARPDAAKPDLEFTIANFSSLLGMTRTARGEVSFRFQFFAGSFSDGGIGEDLLAEPDGLLVTLPLEPANSDMNVAASMESFAGQENGAEGP